jgi:putative membrane protein
MKKIKILAGCLSILLYTTACNSNNEKQAEVKQAAIEPKKVVEVTVMEAKEFVEKAAKGGMAEVEMGKLAVKNAKDKEVKNFAQMMVDDHTKANNELKKIATKQNITVPTSIGEENNMMLNDLKKKTGAEFDKAYIKHMVDGHKKMLDLFEKASTELKDAELKNYAATNVKTLQMHYDKATAIEAKLNATSSSKMNNSKMDNNKMNSGSMKGN